jgi:hypothetical protein
MREVLSEACLKNCYCELPCQLDRPSGLCSRFCYCLLPAAQHVTAFDFTGLSIAKKSICNKLLAVWLLLFRCFLLRAAKHVTACDLMGVSPPNNTTLNCLVGLAPTVWSLFSALLLSAACSQACDGMRLHGRVHRKKQAAAC